MRHLRPLVLLGSVVMLAAFSRPSTAHAAAFFGCASQTTICSVTGCPDASDCPGAADGCIVCTSSCQDNCIACNQLSDDHTCDEQQ